MLSACRKQRETSVFCRGSRVLTWLTLGWFWLTTAQDWAQSWAQSPRGHPCLCVYATGVGSCCACTSTAAASATRMAARATIGALRTVMGCPQTTTTMLGVDSDPTAGEQGEQWATSNGIGLGRSGPPASPPRPVRRGHSKLCSIGPRDCRILSTVGKRSPGNVICEGETHGFETT